MNSLIISVVCDQTELRHQSENQQPICTLTCGYTFTDRDDKEFQVNLTAVAFGEFAEEIYKGFPANSRLILQGEYENCKVNGFEYRRQLVLSHKPILIAGDLNLNCIRLVGRLGKEPDVKRFQSGAVRAEVSLATQRYKDAPTSWHNIQAWGQRAEVMEQYVRKGDRLGIVGSLIASQWRDRETGAYRFKPLVKVERVELLESRREAA